MKIYLFLDLFLWSRHALGLTSNSSSECPSAGFASSESDAAECPHLSLLFVSHPGSGLALYCRRIQLLSLKTWLDCLEDSANCAGRELAQRPGGLQLKPYLLDGENGWSSYF